MTELSSTVSTNPTIGYAPEEINFSLPTRAARLKWVLVINTALPVGAQANAAACVAASAQSLTSGLLGAPARDADGSPHQGLPWAGCSVLAADSATIAAIRAKALARGDIQVSDMPVLAQQTRVYAEYLAGLPLLEAHNLDYAALSLIGERNPVDRLVRRLNLLG